ncbi:uncharacterized protein DC041_0011749 [Schistosoma bovis]|uniref:Tryptophan synthase beta chain-like PALP domain-containing protein n=1 Tax=Schistosoma bovis TaxID=6184 RepID=A0A430QB70_SCHBO|nr:uncharacterized protein DC041_0011749 [Schistosoma bovis]
MLHSGVNNISGWDYNILDKHDIGYYLVINHDVLIITKCFIEFLSVINFFHKGGSSGAAVAGAIRTIKELGLGKNSRIVVILPDNVRNYM